MNATEKKLEINGYPVEVIQEVAVWDEEKKAYQHNYKAWEGKGFWSMGQMSSTSHSFRSLAAAKRSLRIQTNEKAGWSANQSFVIVETVFVGNPELDEVSVDLYASN